MPSFEYQAIDTAGRAKRGHVDADTLKGARILLRERGLTITAIKESAVNVTRHNPKNPTKNMGENKKHNPLIEKSSFWDDFKRILFQRSLRPNDLMLFTQQVSTLISSGISLGEALKLIAEQSDSPAITRTTNALSLALTEGYSFSAALGRSPYLFPQEYIATISAAEESGHMDEVLTQLSEEVEAQGQTSQQLKSALTYPIIMIFVAISVVVLMMIYVVPQIATAFSTTGKDLPTMTKIMIGLSDFIVNYGIYLAIVLIIALILFVRSYMSSERFRFSVHKSMVKMPVFGSMFTLSEVARWSRSLALLLRSGVPPLQSLYIASQVVSNNFLREQFQEAANKVREGKGIAHSIKSITGMPGFAIHMCQSGESAGNLDFMMRKVADYYDRLIKMQVNLFLKLFEPALILVMGGAILTIVLSVLLPVLQMNELV